MTAPIRIGTDTLGLLLPLGTPFARFPLTLGAHPFEDRCRDVLRKINTLDPNITHRHTQLFTHQRIEFLSRTNHQVITPFCDDLLQVEPTKLITQAFVNPWLYQARRHHFVASRRFVVARRIDHLPHDVGVNDDRLLLKRQIAAGVGVQRQDPGIELTHRLGDRHLEVQPGRDVLFNDFTKAQLDRALGLIHHIQAVAGEPGDCRKTTNDDQGTIVDHLAALPADSTGTTALLGRICRTQAFQHSRIKFATFTPRRIVTAPGRAATGALIQRQVH